MDLVWDGALPKYLQHAGRSQDESDSDSDDEDDPDGLAAPEQLVVRSSPLGSASNTATAAAAKEAASRRRERERSKIRGARKEERRLGGSGGSSRGNRGEGASSGASETFADPSSLASAASSLAASTPTVDPNAPSSSSSSTSSYEYSDGDPVWDIICTLARRDAEAEPLLSSYMYTSVLSHETLEQALSFVLANRLADSTLLPTQLMEIFNSVLFADDADGLYIRSALRADVRAIRDRDPACASYVHALLYLKGFHALQAHRIQHALWKRGQKLLALTMQARISTVFAMDLHPAARFGKGILIDHGTGVVVGETAVVGDNVSVLQGVTLGGTGKEAGDRHPKIGRGVLIGAHSTILGNITVGRGAMIAAGSLVLKPVPARTTVAGAPARVVGTQKRENPSMEMCQDIDEETGRDARTGEVCVPEEEGEEGGEGKGREETETETELASLADKMPDDAGFDI
jgi:serine O-acetyltransferase